MVGSNLWHIMTMNHTSVKKCGHQTDTALHRIYNVLSTAAGSSAVLHTRQYIIFLARDVIYTSRAYATMSVSDCL